MTHTDRQRPREMVARAIYEGRNGRGCIAWAHRDSAHKAPYLLDADAAIRVLRDLGYFRHDELALIKQEEGAE